MIEAMHADLIRDHGGQHGLRDPGLLESAIARARHVREYAPASDIAQLAAEYGFGLIRNHAFVDGNKRVAFAATNVFLMLNGFEIDSPEPDVVDVMLRLADGRLTRPKFARWLRSVVVPVR